MKVEKRTTCVEYILTLTEEEAKYIRCLCGNISESKLSELFNLSVHSEEIRRYGVINCNLYRLLD